MPLIITYIMVDKENLVRKNLTRNDGEYIRNIITNPKKKYMEICKNFLTHEDRYCKNKSKVFALKGNTYYSVKKGSIYYNLAKKYNKKITTGVSGSAIMIYQLFFIVLKSIVFLISIFFMGLYKFISKPSGINTNFFSENPKLIWFLIEASEQQIIFFGI